MDNIGTSDLLDFLADELELPESAYESAQTRYDSIGQWFDRKASTCAKYQPHIFPQGSFALGTAVRPINPKDAYDVDLGCSLTDGLFKNNISQKDLKTLVGNELELYRKAKGVIAPLESKHRCWCLEYADELNFHMDIVPCIPESGAQRQVLFERMSTSGLDQTLANEVANLAVSITDDRRDEFPRISENWLGSNPEGYVRWFVNQMQKRNLPHGVLLEKAQVDALPIYSRKTPLQRVVQILKRHRDVMFSKPEQSERKPISIIITTLVANTYSGTQSIRQALDEALVTLVNFVSTNSSEVRNPIDPSENFADKWTMPECKHLNLKQNFHSWVAQLDADLHHLSQEEDRELLTESIEKGFAVGLKSETLDSVLGPRRSAAILTKPAREISSEASKPWFDHSR